MGEIGHNRASFDAVVEENLLRGLYLVHLQALQRCIKDPRLDPCDRLVLAELSECTNSKTGMAYPGRAWLAKKITYYVNGEPKHYSEGTIANSLSRLVDLRYVWVSRRAPAIGGRALSHYTLTAPSLEELQAEIAKACALIRANPKRPFPRSMVISGDDVMAGNDLSHGTSAKTPKNGDFPPAVIAGDDIISSDDISQPNAIFSVADVITSRGQELVIGTGNNNTFRTACETADATKAAQGIPGKKASSPIGPFAEAGSALDLQFEEFWNAFPPGRKQGKGEALDLFRQIVTGKHKKRPRTSAVILIDAVKRYAATKPDPKYTPMPTTWLSGGRWMDDLSGQLKPGSKYDAF